MNYEVNTRYVIWLSVKRLQTRKRSIHSFLSHNLKCSTAVLSAAHPSLQPVSETLLPSCRGRVRCVLLLLLPLVRNAKHTPLSTLCNLQTEAKDRWESKLRGNRCFNWSTFGFNEPGCCLRVAAHLLGSQKQHLKGNPDAVWLVLFKSALLSQKGSSYLVSKSTTKKIPSKQDKRCSLNKFLST